MKTVKLFILTLSILALISCDKENGGSGPAASSGKTISNETVAKELARAVRKSLDPVDNALSVGFSSPVTVDGSSGSVSVSGEKAKTSTGGSSSGYDTKTTDIKLNFSNFSNRSDLTLLSGNGTYYYHWTYEYRNYGSVSSTKYSVSYSLTSCVFSFTYNSEKYTGTVSITYYADKPSARSYKGDVTIEGGQSFHISGYE